MNQIGYLIKRAQHALRQKMDKALAGIGLTLPQYAALVHIGETEGLSNAELARLGFVTPQTMHRIVTGLEKLDYVERLAHPQLERRQCLYLTEMGKRILTQAADLVAQLETESTAGMSEAEVEMFEALLLRYMQTFEG